jgi:hypothetical protein
MPHRKYIHLIICNKKAEDDQSFHRWHHSIIDGTRILSQRYWFTGQCTHTSTSTLDDCRVIFQDGKCQLTCCPATCLRWVLVLRWKGLVFVHCSTADGHHLQAYTSLLQTNIKLLGLWIEYVELHDHELFRQASKGRSVIYLGIVMYNWRNIIDYHRQCCCFVSSHPLHISVVVSLWKVLLCHHAHQRYPERYKANVIAHFQLSFCRRLWIICCPQVIQIYMWWRKLKYTEI